MGTGKRIEFSFMNAVKLVIREQYTEFDEPDVNNLGEDSLQARILALEEQIDDMEDNMPEDNAGEAYEAWEDRRECLLDMIDELQERLEELQMRLEETDI